MTFVTFRDFMKRHAQFSLKNQILSKKISAPSGHGPLQARNTLLESSLYQTENAVPNFAVPAHKDEKIGSQVGQVSQLHTENNLSYLEN